MLRSYPAQASGHFRPMGEFMRSATLCAVLVLVSQTGYAGANSWEFDAYKVNDPKELAFFVEVNDCTVTEEQVDSIVKGVLARSRINPLGEMEWLTANLVLLVSVNCIEQPDANPIVSLDVGFGKWSPIPLRYMRNYGRIAVGDGEYQGQSIEGAVQDAMSTYMEVNFDDRK